MLLTIKENKDVILVMSNSDNKPTILQVADDWQAVAECWRCHGIQYPFSHNHYKVCKPTSKTFLIELRDYLKLQFPSLELLLE